MSARRWTTALLRNGGWGIRLCGELRLPITSANANKVAQLNVRYAPLATVALQCGE
jgi:hypothetical protein